MSERNLRCRVHFQRRTAVDDGYGNEVSGPWETQFTAAAGFKALRGTEPVMAARLSGRQPYIITIRQSFQTRKITTDWRAVDASDAGRVFNIRAISDPDQMGQLLDLLIEQGVAT